MAGILGYLIQSSRERAEKEKQAEKVANASYDLLTPEEDPESGAATPHPYGMTKDQWTGLSRADRIARHAAYQEKLGEQSVLAKIKSYGALEDERRAAVEDERVTGQFLRNYLTAPEPGSGDYGGEAPDATPYAGMEGRFRWAAEQTPNLAGRHLPRIIEALSRYQTVAGKTATPEATVEEGATRAGTPWVRLHNTLMFDPAATAQDRLEKRLQELERAAELRSQPRAVAPAGAVPVTINGVQYLQDPDTQVLYPTKQPGTGAAIADLTARLHGTNAPAAKPAAGGRSAATPQPSITPEQQAVLDDFKAGKLSREAARAKLKQLGLQ